MNIEHPVVPHEVFMQANGIDGFDREIKAL